MGTESKAMAGRLSILCVLSSVGSLSFFTINISYIFIVANSIP
jgi:hypothetical protein